MNTSSQYVFYLFLSMILASEIFVYQINEKYIFESNIEELMNDIEREPAG